MSDTTITIIAIFLAAILMFVFPIVTLSDRNDDITQLAVQTETTEFVDRIRTTGKITSSDYDQFVNALHATGNTYDIEIELKELDENPGKKVVQASASKIGENEYVSSYTTQIEERLANGNILLKEGDIISVKVKNTGLTLSQSLKNFYLKLAGDDTYIIVAEHAGIVAVNGR